MLVTGESVLTLSSRVTRSPGRRRTERARVYRGKARIKARGKVRRLSRPPTLVLCLSGALIEHLPEEFVLERS